MHFLYSEKVFLITVVSFEHETPLIQKTYILSSEIQKVYICPVYYGTTNIVPKVLLFVGSGVNKWVKHSSNLRHRNK